MATLTGINCLTSRLNIGMENCQPNEGLLDGFYRVPKGYSIDLSTTTVNKEFINAEIQQGNIEPFVGCFQAIAETPDPTTEESQSGILSVVRQGKPVITATFKKGKAFHKASFSSNSNDAYDYFLVYDSGFIEGALSLDGQTLKGFDGGMFNTNGYTMNNGTNSAGTTIKIQLKNTQEFNQQSAFLTDLDFNPSVDVLGVIDTRIILTQGSTLSKVNAKVEWLHNAQFPIQGLSTSNFKVYVNGVNDVITGVVESPAGTYEITLTTATSDGDKVVVNLYDATATPPVAVAKLGTKYYAGTSDALTIVD